MWYGVATLVGTIIGVGIFGLPYAASRAGFFTQLMYLGFFSCIFALLHLMYGEVMLRTHDRYRLPGYVGAYMGERAKRIAQAITIISLAGGMLAYVLVGGSFLRMLTGGIAGSPGTYHVIFWGVMSAVVALGLTTIKRVEIIMLVFMVVIIAAVFLFSFPHLVFENFTNNNLSDLFFPYGISMFALSGSVAIPAVRDMLYGNESKMKRTIIAGTLIPAALYAIFVFSIVGIAGSMTSEDAFSGLQGLFGAPIELLGAAFGILAVATSYLIFGLYLRDTLWYDFNVPRKAAMACALFIPLILLFLRPDSYITVIGFLGAVCGGAESIFIIRIFMRARVKGERKPEYAIAIPAFLLYGLIVFFIAGIGYTIFNGI